MKLILDLVNIFTFSSVLTVVILIGKHLDLAVVGSIFAHFSHVVEHSLSNLADDECETVSNSDVAILNRFI